MQHNPHLTYGENLSRLPIVTQLSRSFIHSFTDSHSSIEQMGTSALGLILAFELSSSQPWQHVRITLGSFKKSQCPGLPPRPIKSERDRGDPGISILKSQRGFQCTAKVGITVSSKHQGYGDL